MIAEVMPPAVTGPTILPLTTRDVASLRLRGQRRRDAAAVRRLLTEFPDRSVWTPDTLEYALLAPWRHRAEITLVDELAAVRHAEALLAAAVARCRRAGDALVLVIETDDTRRPAFYARAGLSPIEEVITYELPLHRPVAMPKQPLSFRPALPTDAADLAALTRIDHAAFPWLWRNSEAEFLAYGQAPGVRLYLGTRTGRAVGYVGITTYPGWGHLDRIAIEPDAQGEGLGRLALAFVVDTLTRSGARRIALSTQRANVRSQRLYERFGFRRSSGYDYRLYGAALRPPAPGLTIDVGPAAAGAPMTEA